MNRARCRELFSVAGERFVTWDVVAFAMLRGEWAALEERVRQGLACQKHGWCHRARPHTQEMVQAADEFRYARNLISAEDFEAWLARAGVTFEQWTAYLDRSCRKRGLAVELPAIVSQHRVSHTEVMACVLVEAICSGDLDRFAETLAGRAAVCACNSANYERTEPVDRALVEAVRERCDTLFEGDAPNALRRRADAKRIVHLANIELRFQALVRVALTAEAVRAQIDARCADWVAVGYRSLTLGDLGRAREAALCLRVDGENLDEVATRARVSVRHDRTLVERFDPAWRSTILSAAQGAVLGPLPGPDGFTLAIVDEKVPASARHGSRIDALLAVIEEAEREEILISRRDKIRDRDHRFLLALLINLSDRDTILSRIAETYETADPGALVLKWLSDLSGEHNLGIEIDDLNALLLQHLLAGLSFEEICDRVSSEFSPEEVAAQALELHEHCERLRNHAPLRPLLNAIR